MRIYLDNCCFNRPFDDQDQLKIRLETEAKLHIQQAILDGKYELIWSYILEFENNQNPYSERRNTVAEWKQAAKILCEENTEIITFAEHLLAKGVKVKDALHIACAVEAKADYLLTTDKRLLNTKLAEIEIINPLMFIDKITI